jgi:hypothetical protein
MRLLTEDRFRTTYELSKLLGRKWPVPHERMYTQMEYMAELGYCEEYWMLSSTKHKCVSCKNTSFLAKKDSIQSKFLEEIMKPDGQEQIGDFIVGRRVSMICEACYDDIDSLNDDQYKIRNTRVWTLSGNGILASMVLLNKKKLLSLSNDMMTNKYMKLVRLFLTHQKAEYVDRLLNAITNRLKISPNVEDIAKEWYDTMLPKVRDIEINDSVFESLKDKSLYIIPLKN